MKLVSSRPSSRLILTGLLLGMASAWTASVACAATGAQTAPVAPPPALASAKEPISVPRSVFLDEPQKGRDPFFPDSVRRGVVNTTTNVASSPSAQPRFLDQLSLKGISLGRGRALAIINSVTFSEGEKAEIKLDNQKVLVRCAKIKENSVIVVLEATKESGELQLRKGI